MPIRKFSSSIFQIATKNSRTTALATRSITSVPGSTDEKEGEYEPALLPELGGPGREQRE